MQKPLPPRTTPKNARTLTHIHIVCRAKCALQQLDLFLALRSQRAGLALDETLHHLVQHDPSHPKVHAIFYMLSALAPNDHLVVMPTTKTIHGIGAHH